MPKQKSVAQYVWKYKCSNDPDSFCYVCGKYTLKDLRRMFSGSAKTAYMQYSGIQPDNWKMPWTPNYVCHTCFSRLTEWANGKK